MPRLQFDPPLHNQPTDWGADPGNAIKKRGYRPPPKPALHKIAHPIVHYTPEGELVAYPRLNGTRIIEQVTGHAPPLTGINVTPPQAMRIASIGEATKSARAYLESLPTPKWFGLDLYPYQEAGARSLTAGRPYIADEPGLGKSRQLLAAAARIEAQRIIIVCPSVVVSHWAHETRASRVGGGKVTMWVAGGKKTLLELPGDAEGVIIVPYSMVAHKTHSDTIRRLISQWKPQCFIIDEVHYVKNGRTQRTKALKKLIHSTIAPVFVASGTPLVKDQKELVHQLDICGRINPVFGGSDRFWNHYFHVAPWGEYIPVKKHVPHMRQQLEERVWLRRTKEEVLPDLPEKRRDMLLVDVPLSEYNKAHREVEKKIGEWVKTVNLPSLEISKRNILIDDYAQSTFEHVTALRVAAGLCKIEAAIDLIDQYLTANPAEPLLVWAYHKEVVAALYKAVHEHVGTDKSAIIDGTVSAHRRGEIVESFQKGDIQILVASIPAASVGVTLTRTSQAFFIETDWTPATVIQAEDRIHRIGQTRKVTNTTLIASRTLDESIQKVQKQKADTVGQFLDGDTASHVANRQDMTPASLIMRQLVVDYCVKKGIKL